MRLIDESEFPKRPNASYPWEDWFTAITTTVDGRKKSVVLESGIDFHHSPVMFRQQIYYAASRRGIRVHTTLTPEGDVVVRLNDWLD